LLSKRSFFEALISKKQKLKRAERRPHANKSGRQISKKITAKEKKKPRRMASKSGLLASPGGFEPPAYSLGVVANIIPSPEGNSDVSGGIQLNSNR